MKKFSIFALCLFLLGCEDKKIDTSKPVNLDDAVALFCNEASEKLPKDSHIIIRKKDFESVNYASKEVIHWKIVQNFTERKGLSAHDNDNITVQDLKDKGEIFTIKVHLEKWTGVPYYKGKFFMDKNGVKATDESILRKEYLILADNPIFSSKEQAGEDSASVDEQPIEEDGIGFLKIINKSRDDYITGIKIYKDKSLFRNENVNIPEERAETLELPSGEYKLEIIDSFNKKPCPIGKIKITNEKTIEKKYGGCK